MKRILLLVALLCGGAAVTPALAQKTAPAVTRDSDRDGVNDTRDRCRNTAAGTRVDATGCPAPAATTPPPAPPPSPPTQTATNQPVRPSGMPSPVQPQASPPAPPSAPSGLGQLGVPATTPATTPVTPPAAPPASPTRPAAPPPAPPPAPAPQPAPAPPPTPRVDPGMTAGFLMPAYGGRSETDILEYARTLALRADSAINALVDVFRNTSGAPMVGASGPNVISSRERGRWQRCRVLHFDLRTHADAAAFLNDSLPGGPTLRRGIQGMVDAFEGLQATEECDLVISMIEAPDNYQPWQQNYESSARNFYRDWYTQLRALHSANRTFVGLLNPRLGERAIGIPPALPTRPPTLGGQ